MLGMGNNLAAARAQPYPAGVAREFAGHDLAALGVKREQSFDQRVMLLRGRPKPAGDHERRYVFHPVQAAQGTEMHLRHVRQQAVLLEVLAGPLVRDQPDAGRLPISAGVSIEHPHQRVQALDRVVGGASLAGHDQTLGRQLAHAGRGAGHHGELGMLAVGGDDDHTFLVARRARKRQSDDLGVGGGVEDQ